MKCSGSSEEGTMARTASGLERLAVDVCSFCQWRDDGTLKTVFYALSADADMENLSLDFTCIKVYENANSGENSK